MGDPVSNPPKQKGTGGETELLRLLEQRFPLRRWRKCENGHPWDIETVDEYPDGVGTGNVIRILATRPDRGQWLLSMPLIAYAMGDADVDPIQVEVKRHARFAHHSIFESKFGGKREAPAV
jgi:hypothetical protein